MSKPLRRTGTAILRAHMDELIFQTHISRIEKQRTYVYVSETTPLLSPKKERGDCQLCFVCMQRIRTAVSIWTIRSQNKIRAPNVTTQLVVMTK